MKNASNCKLEGMLVDEIQHRAGDRNLGVPTSHKDRNTVQLPSEVSRKFVIVMCNDD